MSSGPPTRPRRLPDPSVANSAPPSWSTPPTPAIPPTTPNASSASSSPARTISNRSSQKPSAKSDLNRPLQPAPKNAGFLISAWQQFDFTASAPNRPLRLPLALPRLVSSPFVLAWPAPIVLVLVLACFRPLVAGGRTQVPLSLIHISEPTRLGMISSAVFC